MSALGFELIKHVSVTFSESPLNTDTRITRTLWHVPLVYVLTGFHCTSHRYLLADECARTRQNCLITATFRGKTNFICNQTKLLILSSIELMRGKCECVDCETIAQVPRLYNNILFYLFYFVLANPKRVFLVIYHFSKNITPLPTCRRMCENAAKLSDHSNFPRKMNFICNQVKAFSFNLIAYHIMFSTDL